MPDYILTTLSEYCCLAATIGGVIPPEWLNMSERAETLIVMALAFLVLLLTGRLMSARRRQTVLRKEADAAKRNAQHLRALSDARPDMIIFQLEYNPATGSFCFTYISQGLEEMLGIERNHLLQDAQIVLDLLSEEDIDGLRTILREAPEQPASTEVEMRVLAADGTYKWLHISALPQYVGRLLIWDAFVMDISATKRVEQSADQESRNFENLFEMIDDFLLVSDMEGKLLHTNPALQQRMDYTREELDTMSIFELYSEENHPDIYRCVAALHSEAAATCKLPLQTNSGAEIQVEMSLFQGIWKHDKAIFGVARDVARFQQTETALRESKKMLQLIIDSIPMSVFWKDKDSLYLGCNRHFMKECRLHNIDQVVGKTPFDLFGPSEAPAIVERDRRVIATNNPVMELLESHTQPDGSIGWREVSLIPLRNELDKAVGVLGIWRDVTDQNQAEERLKRTLDDMERFNQLMRGRERRTLELKDEINELLDELGKPRKYRTTAADMPS